MAQDFENVLKTSIGTSATEIRAAANSDDAIIGMRFANKGTSAVTVDATVKNSGTSYYLINVYHCVWNFFGWITSTPKLMHFFPSKMKTAKVVPIYKKTIDPTF